MVASGPLEQLILQIVVENVVVGDAQQLASELAPGDVRTARMQARMRFGRNQTELDQTQDVIRIAVVADGAAEDGARFRNAVVFDVIQRVAVGEAFEGETGQEIQILAFCQQGTASGDFHHLAILEEASAGYGVEQRASRTPRESVAERIVGALGRRKSAAVGDERFDFAAALVDLLETFHGQQVVDARIESDFVDDGDSGVDGALVQLFHGVGQVAGRHHVGLGGDALFGNQRMQRVRQQRHHHVRLVDQLLQLVRLVVDVQQDGFRPRKPSGQLVGFVPQRRRYTKRIFWNLFHHFIKMDGGELPT